MPSVTNGTSAERIVGRSGDGDILELEETVFANEY